MCVFLGRAMNFFWPKSRGRGRSPPSPPWIRRWIVAMKHVGTVLTSRKMSRIIIFLL